MLYNRRLWLQQSIATIAGLGITGSLPAMPTGTKPASNAIFLNSNENAYGPSPLAQKAMLEHCRQSNRYPDDYVSQLIGKIAAHWGVTEDNILLGAGSSEIIGLACLHAAKKKTSALLADPGYRVWNGQAAALGLDFTSIPLDAERKTDLPAMLAAINDTTGLVYICNPNNPTGTFTGVDLLTDFAIEASKKSLVFIDEAYTEYANLPSLAKLAITNANIVVAKTFSKVYGLAGARVGYAIAHPETIKKFSSYQPWPNGAASAVSIAAAIASLDDKAFVSRVLARAAEARQICAKTFSDLSLPFIPSNTNFMLFNIDSFKNDPVKAMAARNIFVQSRDHFNGKWCRVSMGTVEEIKIFCETLRQMA